MNTLWKRSLIVGLLFVFALALMAQLVVAAPVSSQAVAVSAAAAGMTDDGLAYDTNDIIVRETYVYTETAVTDYVTWYTLFDGDEFGLSPKHAINAFSISASSVPGTGCGLECVDTIYMSFTQDAIAVPEISPKVHGEDVVAFAPAHITEVGGGDYSMYFDGSDVGLTTTAEKIDGLDVWTNLDPEDVGFPDDCNAGVLFISTQGAYRVPAANGGSLVGEGNDVLLFCATNLGWDTAGFWFRGFDADDQDWPSGARNAISGLDIEFFLPFVPGEQEESEAAQLFFTFTVKKSFNVPNAAGGPSEFFGYPGCNDDVFGPFADLNGEWPALNSVVAGYDLLTEAQGPVCN